MNKAKVIAEIKNGLVALLWSLPVIIWVIWSYGKFVRS